MKYYYVLGSLIFIAFSTASIAQTAEGEFIPEQNAGFKKATKISQSSQPLSRPSVNNEDGYMGKKANILKRLITAEIPASLPKYSEGLPGEEYILLLKSWARNNQVLLKEEYREDKDINEDMYMGKKDDILKRLLSNQIPISLPKYKSGQSSEEYLNQLKLWAKNHPELIKEKYRKN